MEILFINIFSEVVCMNELLKRCVICPRKCEINRYEKKGVCGATNKVRLS